MREERHDPDMDSGIYSSNLEEPDQDPVGRQDIDADADDEVRWTPDYPEAVRWAPDGSAVDVLDQTRLPELSVWVRLHSAAEVEEAIRKLQVRGAPAIGIAGAMGLALELSQATSLPIDSFRQKLRETAALLRGARPTAVNLAWAVDRVDYLIEGPLAAELRAGYQGRTVTLEGAEVRPSRPWFRHAFATTRILMRGAGRQGLPPRRAARFRVGGRGHRDPPAQGRGAPPGGAAARPGGHRDLRRRRRPCAP